MFYGIDFKGWITLAQKYGLPDPLDIMIDPWRPDRWGLYFKYAVTIHCNAKLRCEAAEMDSLQYLESSAGECQVRKATVVSWMTLGVFKTCENLAKILKLTNV